MREDQFYDADPCGFGERVIDSIAHASVYDQVKTSDAPVEAIMAARKNKFSNAQIDA